MWNNPNLDVCADVICEQEDRLAGPTSPLEENIRNGGTPAIEAAKKKTKELRTWQNHVICFWR